MNMHTSVRFEQIRQLPIPTRFFFFLERLGFAVASVGRKFKDTWITGEFSQPEKGDAIKTAL